MGGSKGRGCGRKVHGRVLHKVRGGIGDRLDAKFCSLS